MCVRARKNKHVYSQVCSCVCVRENSLYMFYVCTFVYFVGEFCVGERTWPTGSPPPDTHARAHLTVVLYILLVWFFLIISTVIIITTWRLTRFITTPPPPTHKYFSFLLIYPSEVADLKWACGWRDPPTCPPTHCNHPHPLRAPQHAHVGCMASRVTPSCRMRVPLLTPARQWLTVSPAARESSIIMHWKRFV